MNSTDALPIGGPAVRCSLCGLVARSPIVIAETKKDGELADYGLCKNRKACHVRTIRRERLDAKAATAAGEKRQ